MRRVLVGLTSSWFVVVGARAWFSDWSIGKEYLCHDMVFSLSLRDDLSSCFYSLISRSSVNEQRIDSVNSSGR